MCMSLWGCGCHLKVKSSQMNSVIPPRLKQLWEYFQVWHGVPSVVQATSKIACSGLRSSLAHHNMWQMQLFLIGPSHIAVPF